MTSKRRWILLTLLVAFHLYGVLVVVAFSDSTLLRDYQLFAVFFYSASFGLLAGQICLLSLWGSLGPGALTRRLPVSLLLLILLWYSLVGMARLAGSISAMEDPIYFLGAFAAVYFAVQSPLWLGNKIFNLRIEENETSPFLADKKSLQFSIRTLMLWTAVISVLLALGRFILPWNNSPFRISSSDLVGLSMAIAVITGAVCIIALPSLAVAFLSKNKSIFVFFLGIYYSLLMAFGPGIFVFIVFRLAGGSPSSWREYIELFTAFDSFIIASLTMLWSQLWILHALGFRFKSGQEPIAEQAEQMEQS